ncbi:MULTISPECIES: hypothetical protein [Streptomyces]|uniref:Secreted protein n=1 Tax=Streptomyces thermoviolaceus subsp. thermoviolaceus TaxID=66860 RepID=A0ABX0YR87_STRTL|nr:MULTISPECIES: hypothetical protein [Streptomyces]MCM3263677.1 hypothetical protein [Streptomyces thermoviolaceus]NJP14598.1 hypothetical protein [Streptomyces thermoviolaceus subsp. thermoviolaceus]WTD47855.1 hypothetical protein OG899_10145 [Streptomyces thermoviolaceus]
MARSSSVCVAALTAAAVATVGFLAYRAQATVPPDLRGRPGATASAVPSPSSAPREAGDPRALPPGSGTGERVVYSLGADRVWLVSAGGRVEATFPVAPGTVDPPPGTYAVTSRSKAVTGTDGVPVEHVVRFTSVDGVVIGFSAAVDGATPEPGADTAVKTGGIRESQADGVTMWTFATIGQKVVVVP